MKAVILAGGYGTRISEETHLKPKPMIEIGGRPILWHILKIYENHGITEFIICCGYKGYAIKEYFANYFLHNSDTTIDLEKNQIEVHQETKEKWKVTLIDTGEGTATGGRLKRVQKYVGDSTFCFTYGDGLADVNIKESIEYHRNKKALATLTAVQPPGRFGTLNFERGKILKFEEKPAGDGSWINGGFFVLEPRIFDYIEGDETSWEYDCLPKIALTEELHAYKHHGYWQPMDTLRDKQNLEELWEQRKAPWSEWK